MSKVDMFLKVIGTKTGPIKGDCVDKAHTDEIDVLSWSWGMKSPDMAGTATGKRTFEKLQVRKRIDCATPTLYSALSTNETLKVLLAVRKAGGDAQEYFKIALDQARITSLISHSEGEHPDRLEETVTIAFRKVEMTFRGQLASGLLGPGVTFTDQFDAAQ
jgi:type VI secretion system secreted protein Hcp